MPEPGVKRSGRALPFILIGLVLVPVVVMLALPASLTAHFLPPAVHAEDFSGSIWHGSAGRITVDGRDAGALEWRVHPEALLRAKLAADVRWVKAGIVLDARLEADAHGFRADDVEGAGPIEDLRDLGIAVGWSGTGTVHCRELKGEFAARQINLLAAVGDLRVSNLASPQFANGTDLGGFILEFADGAITPDTDAAAELADTGGPLELRAAIHFSLKERRGLLSGTIKERASAPEALRSQLTGLTQLRPRDSQGRIPVELEFTL